MIQWNYIKTLKSNVFYFIRTSSSSNMATVKGQSDSTISSIDASEAKRVDNILLSSDVTDTSNESDLTQFEYSIFDPEETKEAVYSNPQDFER